MFRINLFFKVPVCQEHGKKAMRSNPKKPVPKAGRCWIGFFFNRIELIAALPCSMCDTLHFFSIPWVLRSIGGPNLSCSLLLSMNDPPLTFSDFSAVWRFFVFDFSGGAQFTMKAAGKCPRVAWKVEGLPKLAQIESFLAVCPLLSSRDHWETWDVFGVLQLQAMPSS